MAFRTQAGSAGSWAALDPATGAILWQVADPNGAVDLGPLAVAKGVVYVDSMAGVGYRADHVGLGCVHWQHPVELRSGLFGERRCRHLGRHRVTGVPGTHTWAYLAYTGNNKFYAFSMNGH